MNLLIPLGTSDALMQQDQPPGAAAAPMSLNAVEEHGLVASNLLAENFDIDDLQLII